MLALTKSVTDKLFLKGCFERKLSPYRPDCLQCCCISNLIIFSVLSPVGQMGDKAVLSCTTLQQAGGIPVSKDRVWGQQTDRLRHLSP